MRINFVKNIHFTKLIKVNNRLREFNFRKLKNVEKDLCTVDVSDDRGNRIMFHMHKEGSDWKIAEDTLPKWIVETEPVLNELIEEELKNS